METTDYCSYELSKKLKECGFNEPCQYYYMKGLSKDYAWHNSSKDAMINYNETIYAYAECSMPTLWQAQKWLREVKHISVRINYFSIDGKGRWFADWLNLDTEEYEDFDIYCMTYEQALSEGIKEVLEMIK